MSPKLPRLTPKKLIKVLQKKGFVLVKAKGSHQFYYNSEINKMVCVPFHTKDLPIGTLHNIMVSSELTVNDLE